MVAPAVYRPNVAASLQQKRTVPDPPAARPQASVQRRGVTENAQGSGTYPAIDRQSAHSQRAASANSARPGAVQSGLPGFPPHTVAQPKLSRPDAVSLYRYFQERFGSLVHFVDWQPHHKAIVLGSDNLENAKRLVDETVEKHGERFKRRNQDINEIISALHDEYWIFSLGLTEGNPTPQDDLIWDELATYLKANKVQSADEVTVHDGAKKTIFTGTATYVLKVYPKSSQVYEREKTAYQTLRQIGADMADFVRQWGWDDQSRTALAEKMDGKLDRQSAIREAKRIVSKLKEKGYYVTDLLYGDNVGYVGQRAVIFDVKSFAKWYEGAPYDVTRI
jgi:hypothetical protein